MKRRDFVRTASMAGLSLSLPRGLWAAAGDAAARKQPDIVIILADDMGYSDIGCFGGEIETPNLDALAANGVRFTQFHNVARCSPSRASLLTGLNPHQAGMGHLAPKDMKLPGYRGTLQPNTITIAEALRTVGYGTCMVGKWHLGEELDPKARGFDRFEGLIKGGANYFDPNHRSSSLPMETATEDYYLTDAITKDAVTLIEEHSAKRKDNPLFLYVAYTAPHWPLQAPAAAIAQQKGRYDAGYKAIRQARFERQKELGIIPDEWKLAPTVGAWDQVANKEAEARRMEVYAAQVKRMDEGIGRVVEALRTAGRLDNTLLLFLSDNGGCAEDIAGNKAFPGALPGPANTAQSYGRAWANVSNTPFREYKHWDHEGGVSTPFIAHWPAGIRRKGAIDRQNGHLIDILPTCLAVSGATYPAERAGNTLPPPEGISLVPAFAGQPLDRKNCLVWEHEGNRAILEQDHWKLVAKKGQAWELYDMEKDGTELDNLAHQMPEKVKELADLWQREAQRTQMTPWPWTAR